MFRSPSGFKGSIQALAAVVCHRHHAGRFLRTGAVAPPAAARPTPIATPASPARSRRPTPIAGRSAAAADTSASAPASTSRATARSPSGWTPPTTSTRSSASPASCAATTATPRSATSLRLLPTRRSPNTPSWPAPPTASPHAPAYAISAFALGGVAIGKFDGDTNGFPATQLGLWPSTNARPAFSLGANFDVNLYPNLAFRIAPNYIGTTFGGTLQNNARLRHGPRLPLRPPEIGSASNSASHFRLSV